MSGTVSGLNMATVSLCEATTGWSGSPAPAPNDPTVFDARQGSYCLQSYQAAGGARSADYTYAVDQNLTGLTVYVWFATSKVLGLPPKGATGMRLRLEDSAGRWAEWDLFGGDTLPHGGWICWAVNMGVAPSRTGGQTPVWTQIRKIGWRCGGVVAPKTYIYWDAVRYGEGLRISGGSSSSPAVFADIEASEFVNAWGVLHRYKGVYFVQGRLAIGSTSGSTYFADVSQAIVFQDALLPGGMSGIVSETNADADTEIYLGSSPGISGCTFGLEATGQTARYLVDVTSAARLHLGLYGCTFRGASQVRLPAWSDSYVREGRQVAFEDCGEVDADTFSLATCNFIDSPGAACLLLDGHRVKQSSFVACSIGTRHSAPGIASYDYDALQFSGCTYDVRNDSGAPITVQKQNGSNPASYDPGGSGVTFTASYQHRLTGLVNGSEVTYIRASDGEVLFHVEQVAGNETIFTHAGGETVDILIHHINYQPLLSDIYGLALPSSNVEVKIQQFNDDVYRNP